MNRGEQRVAVIAPWLMGGGAQGAMTEIILRVRPARDVVVFVLFRGSTGLQKLRDRGIAVIELGYSRTPLGCIAANMRLKRELKGFSTVYSLMRGSHLVLGIAPGFVLGQARFVATFHQLPSSDSAGFRGRLEDAFVRRATRRAELVSVPSRSGAQEVVDFRFAQPERVVHEPNFVQVSDAALVSPRLGSLPLVRLVFAGRVTAQKGLDRLPGLLRQVRRPVHLRIVGDGPDLPALRRSLAQQDSGVHRIEFRGEVSDIVPELDWSDAILMPSRAELNPLVIWEAKARGRGAIVSDISVFRELAEAPGIVLFADGTGLSRAIERLADDEGYRCRMFAELPQQGSTQGRGSRLVDTLTN